MLNGPNHSDRSRSTTPPQRLHTVVTPVRRHRKNEYFVYHTTQSCKRVINRRPALVGDVYNALHWSETCGISGNMRT